jgi:hypothetical protein
MKLTRRPKTGPIRGGFPPRSSTGNRPADVESPQTPITSRNRPVTRPVRVADPPDERIGTSRRRRAGFRWRARDASAAAVGTLGSGVLLLARLVITVASLIALLIGLAIVLRDVDANARNTIVKGVHEGANFFAGAFTGLITFNGHPKRAITVDWGIGLVVYLIVGALLANVIRNIGRGGIRFQESHRPV